jgi:hypothetical protein
MIVIAGKPRKFPAIEYRIKAALIGENIIEIRTETWCSC